MQGFDVTLIDRHEQRVAEVSQGKMPFLERGAEDTLAHALAADRLRATTSASSIAKQDVVVVTIGTPVDEFLDPDIRSFDRAIESVLDEMVDGQLLILRSTVFPGVTDRLAREIAKQGKDIDLAHCPERIAQGYALEELTALPQIVGGATPRATERAAELFAQLGAQIIKLKPVEAELAKLFANAYRYINFAISNQFYVMASRFDADFNQIHEAVTRDYPRLSGFAKAGFAGGPCLLKDTMQLAAFNHNAFALGQAAMMVNEGLPSALVEKAALAHDLPNLKAAVLGMAFKGNSDDPRDSLSYKLRKILTLRCRDVLCTDPYIEDPSFVSLEEALNEADIVFVGACHQQYAQLQIDKPVYDPFGFLRQTAQG